MQKNNRTPQKLIATAALAAIATGAGSGLATAATMDSPKELTATIDGKNVAKLTVTDTGFVLGHLLDDGLKLTEGEDAAPETGGDAPVDNGDGGSQPANPGTDTPDENAGGDVTNPPAGEDEGTPGTGDNENPPAGDNENPQPENPGAGDTENPPAGGDEGTQPENPPAGGEEGEGDNTDTPLSDQDKANKAALQAASDYIPTAKGTSVDEIREELKPVITEAAKAAISEGNTNADAIVNTAIESVFNDLAQMIEAQAEQNKNPDEGGETTTPGDGDANEAVSDEQVAAFVNGMKETFKDLKNPMPDKVWEQLAELVKGRSASEINDAIAMVKATLDNEETNKALFAKLSESPAESANTLISTIASMPGNEAFPSFFGLTALPEPGEETEKPGEETEKPGEETEKPGEDSEKPSEKPGEDSEKPSEPSEPSGPTDEVKPSEPTDETKPSEPSKETETPQETEKPSEPSDNPAPTPGDDTTKPSEEPGKDSEPSDESQKPEVTPGDKTETPKPSENPSDTTANNKGEDSDMGLTPVPGNDIAISDTVTPGVTSNADNTTPGAGTGTTMNNADNQGPTKGAVDEGPNKGVVTGEAKNTASIGTIALGVVLAVAAAAGGFFLFNKNRKNEEGADSTDVE